MHFWMDISQEDMDGLLAIVVGCDKCALREVYTDYEEARLWIGTHDRVAHTDGESKSVRRSGTAPYVFEKRGKESVIVSSTASATPAQELARELIIEAGTIGTQEYADLTDASYNTAYVLLNRMAEDGKLVKVKAGGKVLWQATDGPRELLEGAE
jgi:hypothetical protein